MATQAEIHECVWRVAGDYLSRSYEELAALEKSVRVAPSMQSVPGYPSGSVECGGSEAFANVIVSQLGLFRPRICIEVILTGGGEGESQYTSIVYFERFRSGKLKGPWGPAPISQEYGKQRRRAEARDRP